MRLRHALLMLSLGVIAGGTAASAASAVMIHNGFVKGNDFRRFDDSDRRRYVMGWIDGALVSPLWGADRARVRELGACIEGATDEQLAAVLARELEQDPGEWHRDMHAIAYRAIMKMCPGFAP